MNGITKKILSVFRKILGIILCLVVLLTALQFLGVFDKSQEILKDTYASDIKGEILGKIGEAEQFCRLNGRLPTELPHTRYIKITAPQYVTDIPQPTPSDFLKEKMFLLTITALKPDDVTKTLDGYRAFSVDSSIDDGLPNSGKIRFIGSPECLSKSDKGEVTYNKDYKDLKADCTAFTIQISCEKKGR